MSGKSAGAFFAAILVLCMATFVEAEMSYEEFIDLCGKGTPSEIQTAIEAGADVKKADKDKGFTPLHIAAEKNPDAEAIRVLLKAGAAVNAKSKAGENEKAVWVGGFTPLHRAAACNPSAEVTIALLKAGADVMSRDDLKCTPLHWAAGNLNKDVAAALLKAGAKVNAKDDLDSTPLHGLFSPNPEVLKVLLQQRF